MSTDHDGSSLRLVVPEGPAAGAMPEADFARLCEEALPRVYAYVRAQVGRREIAQEIVGRVFLKACSQRAHLPTGEAAVFWLFRVAFTTLVDYRRVDARREALEIGTDELDLVIGTGIDPELACLTRERAAHCFRLMGELSELDHNVMLLKFAGQRTNGEIAEILNLSSGAVGMRLLRALRWLRCRLQEAGV